MALATASSGGYRIEAVSVRERGEHDEEMLAVLLEEMRDEIGARTTACSMALRCDEAHIDEIQLPSMPWGERRAAALLETERRYGVDSGRVVRLFRTNAIGHFGIGTVKKEAVDLRLRLARRAGLRLVHLEHESTAFRHLADSIGCVIDVGNLGTRVYRYETAIPRVYLLNEGGFGVTEEIARSLHIDHRSAERRKRIIGALGDSETSLQRLVAWFAATLEGFGRKITGRCMFVGNGIRLPELRAGLSALLPSGSLLGSCDLLERSRYPVDLQRAAFSDWALAVGLSTCTVT